MDLGSLTTKEEVNDALRKETGNISEFKVHVFEPNAREQSIAVIETDQNTATSLLKKGSIKIGYISGCKIRLRAAVFIISRCYRCQGYGYKKTTCKRSFR